MPGDQDGLRHDPLRPVSVARGLALVALLLPAASLAAAPTAERKVQIASFDRLRVEGAFQVTVATGRSASAVVSGDPRRLERVEVRLAGTTLVVRNLAGSSRDGAGDPSAPVTVTLATSTLAGASVLGGGALTIVGGRAQRLDLSVAGAGSIALTAANVEQADATVIGNGRIMLAGRAARARLQVSGAGGIDADGLEAGELTVRVDGPGETTARARYTATVTNTGLGRVTIAGTPKCVVKSDAGGPVVCGVAR